MESHTFVVFLHFHNLLLFIPLQRIHSSSISVKQKNKLNSITFQVINNGVITFIMQYMRSTDCFYIRRHIILSAYQLLITPLSVFETKYNEQKCKSIQSMRAMDKVQRFCICGLSHGAKEIVVDCVVVIQRRVGVDVVLAGCTAALLQCQLFLTEEDRSLFLGLCLLALVWC